MMEGLTGSGWHLSQEGLTKCQAGCTEKGWPVSDKNLIKIALDLDLRSIADSTLPRPLPDELNGPLVLQIQKVKNVAVSSRKQHVPSPGKRLLRFYLTDGHAQLSGVEIEGPLEKLSPVTAPGTKVNLCGTVKVQNGFLLLTKSSLQVLGGQVEHLLKKWNIQKITPSNQDRSKSGGSEGPPVFKPFSIESTRGGGKSSAAAASRSFPQQEGSKKKTYDKPLSQSGSSFQPMAVSSRSSGSKAHGSSKDGSESDHRMQAPPNKSRPFKDKQDSSHQHSQHSMAPSGGGTHQGQRRTDRRSHHRGFEDDTSRGEHPPSGPRGRGLARDVTRPPHDKTPYDKKEGVAHTRPPGRGRGQSRHGERDYEPQNPKKSYDLADFFGDKLKLATSQKSQRSEDPFAFSGAEYSGRSTTGKNHTAYETPTQDRSHHSQRRDDKRTRDYSSGRAQSRDKYRGGAKEERDNSRRDHRPYPPREAWTEDKEKTKQTFKGEAHTQKGRETQPAPKHGKGGNQTAGREEKGHWDWISEAGAPSSARKL